MEPPLPLDVISNAIMPYCTFKFMLLSKKLREIARKSLATNLHLDKKNVLLGVESAAKYGDMELLNILLQHPNADKSCVDNAAMSATKEGLLDVVIYLCGNFLDLRKASIIRPAVLHNQYAIIEYMLKEKLLSVSDFLHGCSGCNQKTSFDYIVDNFAEKYDFGPVSILTEILLHNEDWLDKTLKVPNLVFDERIIEHKCRTSWESKEIDIMKILKHPRAPITETLLCMAFNTCRVTLADAKMFFDRAPNLAPTANIIHCTIHKDYMEVFEYVLTRPGASRDIYDSLRTALGADLEQIFDLILEKGDFNAKLLKEAIAFGAGSYQNRGKYLTKMLARAKNLEVEPFILQSMEHLAFYSKAEYRSKMQEDQTLDLLKYPGVDLTHQTQLFFRLACENGWINIVNYLLECPRVNPGVVDNICIRSAALSGHLDVVKKLLADPRVNPAAYNNHAIQCAVLGDNIEIVKLLIADPRVNPAANDNYAYKKAKSQAIRDLLLQNDIVKAKLAAKK
jgi:hypothetical protein